MCGRLAVDGEPRRAAGRQRVTTPVDRVDDRIGQREPAAQRAQHGPVTLLAGDLGDPALAGVLAHQVVEDVSHVVHARPHGLHQARVDELLDGVAGRGHVQVRPVRRGCGRRAGGLRRDRRSAVAGRIRGQEDGGHPGRDVGRVELPEQAVQAAGRAGQAVVGDVERGAHAQAVVGQLVQSVPVAEPRREVGHPPVRPGGQLRAGDAQRQRQPSAQPEQVLAGARLGTQPPRPDDAGQQLPCRPVVQYVQLGLPRTGQRGQPRPAGDDHPAAGAGRAGRTRAGQQRRHLVLVGGVVQHDQDPAVGQHGPVQGGAFARAVGDRRATDTQRPQEPAQDLRGRGRVRLAALQIGVEPAVGEVLAHHLGDVPGQGGLADPAHPGDGDDAAVVAVAAQHTGQCGDVAGPAGEVGDRRRHLVRPPFRRGDVRPRRGLLPQHPQVDVAHLLPGCHAELLVQAAAQSLVRVERLGLTATSGQRLDPGAEQRLVHGVPLGERPDDRHGPLGVTGGDGRAGEADGRGDQLAVELSDRRLVGDGGVQVLQRPAAPQRQRVSQRGDALGQLGGRGTPGQLAERHDVGGRAGQA